MKYMNCYETEQHENSILIES